MMDYSDAIPIGTVPNHMPKQANGKKVNITTVYRWINRARNPLGTFKVGGRRFTNPALIEEFVTACNEGRRATETASVRHKRRQREIDAAQKALEAIGI